MVTKELKLPMMVVKMVEVMIRADTVAAMITIINIKVTLQVLLDANKQTEET